MAERPAKRQRTSIHSLPDSDDEPISQNKSSLNTTASRKRLATINCKTSVKTTPEKPKKSINRKPDPPTKSLHSFFSRATDEQRWRKKSATPEPDLSYAASLDDDIVDDEDDSFSLISSQQSDVARDAADRARPRSITPSSTSSSTQRRFVRPGAATAPKSALSRSVTQRSTDAINDSNLVNHKPWADRFGPETVEELAIHKKKVGDVQQWLGNVLAGRERQRLLVLKGPAGCGKSTTISMLARARNVQVVSWQNPVVPDTGATSVMQQFSDFLNRGSEYEALDMRNENQQNDNNTTSSAKIILVEEFPFTMTRSSKPLDDFRSTLLTYLAASNQDKPVMRQSLEPLAFPPVVLAISETLLSSSTALTDSFTAHRLLGTDLSTHPLVNIIEFNPVAATFITKALDLVVKKEARISARRRIPGPAVMSTLAEIGDIRSAINSLEFFCARGDQNADWSGTVAGRGKKKDSAPLTEMEKNTLRIVSQRESTLDMFHATGKIVYNKREDPKVQDTRAEPPPKPPDHLMHLHVPQVSQVDVEALLGETGTDIQTFISTLHENFVLSCNGDSFCDSLDACAETLSDSDILNPDSRALLRSTRANAQSQNVNLQSGNSEMLRQDEISFHTACRGLLFSLPYPVHRAVPPNVRKQDAFKMFYPASLRIWKPAEEIRDLIALFRRHGVGSGRMSTAQPTLPGEEGGGGVASWRSRGLTFGDLSSNNTANGKDVAAINEDSPSIFTMTSEDTNILDILPYAAKISSVTLTTDIPLLKKTTQFCGSSLLQPTTADPADDDGPDQSYLSTTSFPKPRSTSTLSAEVEAAHNSILSHRQRQQQNHTSLTNVHIPAMTTHGTTSRGAKLLPAPNGSREKAAETEMPGKLYISDDDIVDD